MLNSSETANTHDNGALHASHQIFEMIFTCGHFDCGEDRTCSSEDMITDRQTHTQTDRQTDTLITILHFPIGGGVQIIFICDRFDCLPVYKSMRCYGAVETSLSQPWTRCRYLITLCTTQRVTTDNSKGNVCLCRWPRPVLGTQKERRNTS